MTDIVVGCDTNTGNDASAINTVVEGLKQAGYNVVEQLSIGPSPFSQYGYTDAAKGKIGIYLMAASLVSFADGYHDLYDYDIFIIRGDASALVTSQETFQTAVIPRDSDCNSVCDEFANMTYPQMNQKAQGKCVAVYGGKTGEEMLQAAINALNGQGVMSGGTTESGGSVVSIPDKTFYGLIKQICGAIDGIFITANNMAYLLSFKDLYKYREKFKDHIPILSPSEILTDSVIHNWTTAGFYNAVEVTYSGGTIKYQHDALVEMYGESVFYYEFPSDDEETAKAKANALLSAHVRDYSLDLQLNCIYNPNITVGSWLKVPKTVTKTTGATSVQTAKIQRERKQEKTLRKGVTIENITSTVQTLKNGQTKKINTITTEDGQSYDVEVSTDEYEYYFVQSYKLRWTPQQSPIMKLHLKYGPDTPEDPINATIGTGSIEAGSNANSMYGEDCFGTEISQLYGDHRIPHSGSGGVEYATQNPPTPEMTAGRCKQGSKYEEEVRGKTGEEVFYLASSKFVYCLYADNCHLYKCNDERWNSGECGFNCGDSATILKSLLDCVGIKNWIFHIDGHYHQMVEVDGKITTADLSRRSDSITHAVGWPSAQRGSCHCPCRSG